MTAALALGGIGLALACLLCVARLALAGKEKRNASAVVDAVDALLPQTQCAQCGYPGCRPYAEAVVAGARTDLCAPGGPDTAARLRDLVRGEGAPSALPRPHEQVARIVAGDCVGCGLCLAACPVDAIAGAPQFLHAVVSEHCTGCELCVPACPVDCIQMVAPTVASGFPESARVARESDIVARIAAAGVVGMGGGGYPTASKIRAALAAGADCVVANGMASEPGATADTTLLRDHLDEVVAGLRLVGQCLGGEDVRLVLAVPPGSRLPQPAVEVDLPYPAGDERALVRRVTGRPVPAGGHPTDVGVLVLNVATLFAVQEAVAGGKALDRRLLTVDGTDVWLALGTPLGALPVAAGTDGLRVNGLLTGRPATRGEVVEATTFAVDAAPKPSPCIGCGWCEPTCPEGLAPENLHATFDAGRTDADVFACTECGACAAACPSAIDLVNEFRVLKRRTGDERLGRARANTAKARWEARDKRLADQARQARSRRETRLRAARQW